MANCRAIRRYLDDVRYPSPSKICPGGGNVAVGGSWPASPDDSTVFPRTMRVDYVPAYEKSGG